MTHSRHTWRITCTWTDPRPPFSFGPRWTWIKPGPMAIQTSGLIGGGPGYIYEEAWPHSHLDPHTHTLNFSYRITDRIQPTPIWCTACPVMHSCKRLSTPYPKWSWQAQLRGLHMLATAIWTDRELMLNYESWANFLHRLTKYTKS